MNWAMGIVASRDNPSSEQNQPNTCSANHQHPCQAQTRKLRGCHFSAAGTTSAITSNGALTSATSATMTGRSTALAVVGASEVSHAVMACLLQNSLHNLRSFHPRE